MNTAGDRWRGWAGDWAGSWTGVRPASGIRIGDAEREAAISALGEHYAAGRLTKEEYDERAGRAWTAKTGSDLAPLFSDLPRASARPVPPPQPSQRSGRQLRVPFLPLMLIMIGVIALTHAVWPVLLAVGVLWWVGMFRWGGRRRGCRGGNDPR